MSRLRARLARSELDSQVQGHVASAERAIRTALQLVRKARIGPREASSSRYLQVEKDLSRVLNALGNVNQVAPLHDTEDPDLNPSALDRWRQEQQALRDAQAKADAEAKSEPEEVGIEPEPDEGGGD